MDKRRCLQQFGHDLGTGILNRQSTSSFALEIRLLELVATQPTDVRVSASNLVLLAVQSDTWTNVKVDVVFPDYMRSCLDDLVMEPGFMRLPLNDEHVLFLPGLHTVTLTSSRTCNMELLIGAMRPHAAWMSQKVEVLQLLRDNYAVASLGEMTGVSSCRRGGGYGCHLRMQGWNGTEDSLYTDPGDGGMFWRGDCERIVLGSARRHLQAAAVRRIERAYKPRSNRRQKAAATIQSGWRHAVACPLFELCRKRLLREFTALRA